MSNLTVKGNASGTGTVILEAPNTNSNRTITLPDATTTLVGNSSFAGMVAFFAMNTAPSGWLDADGSAVSRTTYDALFAAIGTTFGSGDGSTTFNLPDLRGEFPRGWDDGRGVDTGRAFGSAQAEGFKSHQHGFNPGIGTNTGGFSYGRVVATGGFTAGTIVTNLEGGTETRPRNIALLACIKF